MYNFKWELILKEKNKVFAKILINSTIEKLPEANGDLNGYLIFDDYIESCIRTRDEEIGSSYYKDFERFKTFIDNNRFDVDFGNVFVEDILKEYINITDENGNKITINEYDNTDLRHGEIKACLLYVRVKGEPVNIIVNKNEL